MSASDCLLIVASERAARAASFDPECDGLTILALDAWLSSLADALDPRVTEASWLEELTLAAQVLHERGGNPSAALAQEVTSRLRQLEESALDPSLMALRLGIDPDARGDARQKRILDKDRVLAAIPHIEPACVLARRLAQRNKRSRASSARLVAERMRSEPLFVRTLTLPLRVIVRDVVRLTPAVLGLFAELSQSMERQGKRFEIELALVERPLGGAERDALERIGDLYAEALDGPPTFRAVPEEELASCTHYAEAEPDAALVRSMALASAALDAGRAPDSCGLAWRSTLSDGALRALAHAARGARVPVLAERRAVSARGVDELLRWCELLSAELRFDELLALLRSPLLELDLPDAEEQLRQAIRRLISAPLPRGAAASVLVAVADAEVNQPGVAVFRVLADLAVLLTDAKCCADSAHAIGAALSVLGLARGASRGGTAVFRAERWQNPADRALLASIAFEERALASFDAVRSSWLAAVFAMGCAEMERGVGDLARDLRAFIEAEAPRMAGSAASLRTGTFGALAAEGVGHVIVPDASFEAWSPRLQETLPALVHAERLRNLAQEAEWLHLRMAARRVDVITSSSDARGEPQRLHPMFAAALNDDAAATGSARLVLTRAEREAREVSEDAAVLERIARQRAREGWRGDSNQESNENTGLLPGGLPWLATAESPLSPHAAEQFVACPYRGFAVQELRARSENDADSVADPMEEGRILHTLLERAFLAAREELSRPEPNATRVRELGETAALAAGAPLLVGIRKVQVGRLLTWVTRALDEAARDRTWRFDTAEIPFGPGHAWPAVEVDGTFYAGRIDRVDRARGAEGKSLRVVDYKRSAVGGTKLRLQLPIYAIAAERNDALSGTAKEGVYLVPRRASGSAGIRRVELEPSATEVVRESIVPTLSRLRGGDVAPRPNTPAECKSCAVRGVCRRPPFRIQEGQ